MPLILLRPWWLLALIPLGFLLWRLWRKPEPVAAFWHAVVDAHLLPHVLLGATARARRMDFALLALALVCAVLALAGPALKSQLQPGLQRDVLRVLVVDLSGQGTNPAQATSLFGQLGTKLRALLRALPDGQSALIVYAGEPYLVVPPTTDSDIIARFAPELSPDVVPVPGNRPGDALRMAQGVLDRSGARERTVLWITAAGDAALPTLPVLHDVRLGILRGAADTAPALEKLARRSGGMLMQMRADNGDVQQLAAAFGTHGTWRADDAELARDVTDLGYWLLLPLLLLAVLVWRGGVLGLLLPLLLAGLLSTPQPAAAAELLTASVMADLRGWALLVVGNPEAAANQFADLRWRAVACYRAGRFAEAAHLLNPLQDAGSLYNRGNALARLGRYADALAAYERSLVLQPDGDARHNHDLMRRLLNQPNRTGKSGSSPAAGSAANAQHEADRVAEQWLRGVPDEPASLLRRKLLQEQRRRESGQSVRAW